MGFIDCYYRMDWTETNSYLKGIMNHYDELPDPTRIASFDLDDTLIHRPKSNSKNKESDTKWKLLDSNIKNKIADLVAKKYLIVIFTNQSGMGSGKNFDKPKWRIAMNDLAKILLSETSDKYYFAVYVAKKHDLYRKPNLGMWDQMKIDLRAEFKLGKKDKLRISKKSFFCGDAAGRKKSSIFKKKIYPSSTTGDFSDTDRKFALNIGIDFVTPEEFYLDDAPKMDYELSGVDPSKYIDEINEINEINEIDYQFKPRKKEMIIMIGPPGSGKSEFVKKYILPEGYIHVNQDTCKTRAKCIAQATDVLGKKKSVVIDNTNPDVLSRMNCSESNIKSTVSILSKCSDFCGLT